MEQILQIQEILLVDLGKKTVSGKFLSSSEILCTAPPVTEPGYVDLTVSFYAGLDSAAV